MPLAVMLRSAVAHLPPGQPVVVCLLDGGFREGDAERIERAACGVPRDSAGTVEFRRFRIDLGRFGGYSQNAEYSGAIYMRLLLPELLREFGKVLYLDSDVFVRQDLTPLWQTDVQGRYLAAVQDVMWGTARDIFRDTEPSLEPETPCFNSGVMLVNLDRWRAEDLPAKLFAYLARHRVHFDQHALNACVQGEWLSLAWRWNFTSECLRPERQPDSEVARSLIAAGPGGRLREAAVVHFTGANKPWQGCLLHPFRAEYHRCLRQTGWMTPAGFAQWRRDWRRKAVRRFVGARLASLRRENVRG